MLCFYNGWHSGDVHVSREFVRDITNKLPNETFSYMHNNSPRLLLDQPRVQHVKCHPSASNIASFPGTVKFIDTWYGARGGKYQQKWCNFSTLYSLFTDVYQDLGIKLEAPIHYLPRPIWGHYQIGGIDAHLASRYGRKRCLISNCDVQSGQSSNFLFDGIVANLAARNPTWDFYITNPLQSNSDNVFHTSHIIPPLENDLNENAYLSTRCDLIVGRGSGPFTFAYNQYNLLNPLTTFICFSNQESIARWHDDVQCKIVWSNDYTNVEQTIQKEISL